MAWLDSLNLFRSRKSALLNANADPNSITPGPHSEMLDPLADAVQQHAEDQSAHSGGLPSGSGGSILYNDGTSWLVLPAGAVNQLLSLTQPGSVKIPTWINAISNINLAFDSDGYCFNGVEKITGVYEAYISCKNIKLYDPQNSKHVYLTNTGNRTFKLNLSYDSPFTKAYFVIKKTDLTNAADGDNVELTKAADISDSDIVLMEVLLNAGSKKYASGLLVELATSYKISNSDYDNVAVAANVATIDVGKYNKALSRFYITHNDNLTVNTTSDFINTDGFISIDNTSASGKVITFDASFESKVVSIEANSNKLFYFYKKTDASSRLTVVDLTQPIGGGSGDMLKSTYDPTSVNGDAFSQDNMVDGTTNKNYTDIEKTKLAGIEDGAEVNNISDVNASDLTDAGDSSLHYHNSDRNRANHIGTQPASTISDFDIEVSNNTDVTANTAKVSFPEAPNDGQEYVRKNKAWAVATGGGGGGAAVYTDLTASTDFSTTAPSTSTITMITDQTANITPGTAIKFTLKGASAGTYYAICTAITSSLLTIAGAPLTTGAGELSALSYSNLPDATHVEPIVINGAFADNLDTTLIESDLHLKGGLVWKKSKAYCVQMSIIATDLDNGTATNEAKLNAVINSSDLLSSDLEVSNTLQNSVVQINTANYDVNYGESIELDLAALATGTPNNDALNLTCYLTFVYP